MSQALAELLEHLTLERLETRLFRGVSRDIGSPQVYGGQVLGQALNAAYATVAGREVHSLHAYFLRRGDVSAPILYEVDRSRDGQSFSSRRVVAIQNGEQIFHMSASFHVEETGLSHQQPMPQVPLPESLPDLRAQLAAVAPRLPPAIRRFAGEGSPFEFRVVTPQALNPPVGSTPRQEVWFRTAGALPDIESQHRSVLAYVTDYFLINTALRPYGLTMASPGMVVASIDHAMWFHRPFRIDQWLLYAIESPTAAGARGFARAGVYTAQGELVASTAQEGLMRKVDA